MTQTYQIYKLNFTSPLHISLGKDEYDKSSQVIHSDTIKSALISCAYYLGYSEEVVTKILNGCILSSAFPFYGEEYFFPKPFARLMPIANQSEERQGKYLKKIQYLGKSYFEQLLDGAKGQIEETHLIDHKKYVSESPELVKNSATKIIASSVNQRVTIAPDHIEDAKPFYTERLFFPDEAGLFFIVQFADSSLEDTFHGLLKLLGDNGIGTDRSVGNGFFKPERDTLTLTVPDKVNHQVNLSLFCPTEEDLKEIVEGDSSWQLIKRGGYLAGTQQESNITLRKRSIYMLQEGSVLPNRNMDGKIVNLRPKIDLVKHPIWREGRSIFIPIQIPENYE